MSAPKTTEQAPDETPAATEEQQVPPDAVEASFVEYTPYQSPVYGIWNGSKWEKDHNGRVLCVDSKCAMMAELHNLRMSDHLNTAQKSRLSVEEIGYDGLPVPVEAVEETVEAEAAPEE